MPYLLHKARAAVQGTIAAKDIDPNQPKLQPLLRNESVHGAEGLYIVFETLL